MRKLILLPLALLAAGCSLNRTAAKVTSGVIDKGLPSVFSQEDPQYVREALPANLQLMEILLKNDPKNRKMLVNAAQGFCGYAFMFLEDEEPARASAFYLKGRGYAERAMKGDPDPEKAGKKDVPALFWHTFCNASYVNVNRADPEAIAELPGLEPAALKLLELSPSYYYNGAQSVLGAYYSIRPRMFGGNPEKAKEHFELALKGDGEAFMMNRYMYAKMAAVAAQDPELFEELLTAVIDAEPREGATRLADEVARIKAKKLLEKKNELF